jgi:hypothetical protein
VCWSLSLSTLAIYFSARLELGYWCWLQAFSSNIRLGQKWLTVTNTLAYCIALSLIEIYTSNNSYNCGLHLFCRRKWLIAEYSTTTYWNGALCLLLVKAYRWQLWKGSHFNLNIKSDEKSHILRSRVVIQWKLFNYSGFFLFVQRIFSCNWVFQWLTKSPVEYWFIKTRAEVFIQKMMVWLKTKWN